MGVHTLAPTSATSGTAPPGPSVGSFIISTGEPFAAASPVPQSLEGFVLTDLEDPQLA